MDAPDKGVSFIFEDADLLDLTVRAENLLKGLLGGALGQVTAIDGAVGGRRLAKDFVVRERLGAGCNWRYRNKCRKPSHKHIIVITEETTSRAGPYDYKKKKKKKKTRKKGKRI